MATMERTWQFDINRAYSPSSNLDAARYMQWYVKAFLKGEIGGAAAGLWTCLGSSDAATAGLDGVDRWGDAYIGLKIVRAAAGTAHSWICLKSPVMNGANWYLVIDYSSTTDKATRFAFSKAAPTGGTTLNRPTSTDEWYPGSAFGDNTIYPDGVVTFKLHAGLTTDGSCYVLRSIDATSLFSWGLAVQAVANSKAGDSYPLWTYAQYNTATRGAFVGGVVAGGITDFSTFNVSSYGRSVDGALTQPVALIGPSMWRNGVAITALDDEGADAADGTRWDWPCWIGYRSSLGGSGQIKSVRGRLVDFAMCPSNALPVGSTEPIGGPYTSMVSGNLWVPTNAAPLL